MKTNILYKLIKLRGWALLLLLPLFVSCSDQLVEHPKAMVVENFYNTPEEVESATNAIYNPLRTSTQMAVYEATMECLSDFVYGRGSWTQIGEFKKLNDANITRVEEIWKSFYLSIRGANLVIQNSPAGSDKIDVFIAEARFLRAFVYFQLVRNWGGVPLRTEENMAEISVSKSSSDVIYGSIINDLVEAGKVLPEKRDMSGRPSKWSAKTLLADVYLQLGKYKEARINAEEVVKSGQFSLIPVKSKEDFQNDVFGPMVTTSSEEIFYLKYSNIVSGQNNYILWILNHFETGGFPFGGAYAIYGDLTNPIYKSWDDRDLRKQLWSPVEFGLGRNTLVSTKFIDKNAINKNGGANDDPVYGYSDLLLIYAEAINRDAGKPSDEALEAVNQIRRRAYGYNPKVTSEVDYKLADYPTVDLFGDLVMKERGYEFQVEGKRWMELKRMGKAKQVIKAVKGIDISDVSFLWPIPVNEINYNTALDPNTDQNPGY